ncbi:unnamed protein product [Prunus armeniaca]
MHGLSYDSLGLPLNGCFDLGVEVSRSTDCKGTEGTCCRSAEGTEEGEGHNLFGGFPQMAPDYLCSKLDDQ